MLLALAVLLGMLGCALLVLGQVRLPGGRVLRPWPGRCAGLVFLSFVPLVIAARLILEHYANEGEPWAAALYERYLTAVSWGLFVLCLVLGVVVIVRGSRSLTPARPRRPELADTTKPFARNPFAGASEPAAPPDPTPRPAPKQKGPKPVRGQEPENPFDFS